MSDVFPAPGEARMLMEKTPALSRRLEILLRDPVVGVEDVLDHRYVLGHGYS